jgi:hypothetical protein
LKQLVSNDDAEIDDPELFNKKDLLNKQNPLSLMNQLGAKWRAHGNNISLNDCFETRDAKTSRSVWHYRVGIKDLNLFGQASHNQKKVAQFMAAQRFLKLLFPKGTTWMQLVALFSCKERTDELNKIIDETIV